MPCLLCLWEPGLLLPRQNCLQKDCGVITTLIPYTLWQQGQQTAHCAAKLPKFASSNALPLPSHTQPRCTPISSLHVWKTLGASNRCSGSLANALPPPKPPFASHASSPSIIPRNWEVRNKAEQRNCIAACTGLEQLSFYLPGLENLSTYPASSCLAVRSALLNSHCHSLRISVEKALSTTWFS